MPAQILDLGCLQLLITVGPLLILTPRWTARAMGYAGLCGVMGFEV